MVEQSAMSGILYFTELLGMKVFDLKGRGIGRIKDAALVPLIDPVRVDRFFIGGGLSWLSIRHDQIRSISLAGIHLADEKLTPYHSDEYMLRLSRDLLDQQIIDAAGRKVVRVTDITFGLRDSGNTSILVLEEIDIGLRSIFRRLVQGVLPPRWIRRLQGRIPPHSLDWAKCSILEADPMRRLRLNLSNRLLEEMHPADLADIVEELGPDDREAIFTDLDAEVAADALTEVDPDVQASIFESLDAETAADIMEEMSPHEAADALGELGDEQADEILEEMEDESKGEIEELLEFNPNTAGGMMNTEYVALPQTALVRDALNAIRAVESAVENVNTLYLIDDGARLVAAVPVARLLLQEGETALQSLAMERLVVGRLADRQDQISELFDKYNLLCLPVVDRHGVLSGVITADEIISLLRKD